MSEYLTISNQSKAFSLTDVPCLDYGRFYTLVLEMMEKEDSHCVNYFAFPLENELMFLCIIGRDDEHTLAVLSHRVKGEGVKGEGVKSEGVKLKALSAVCFAFHGFEREIHENFGIDFEDHPWLKPIRFPFSAEGTLLEMKDYPFYKIESEELHEVGVGPVHAGIIEPGHFRFLCNGETVLHLEIQLGYQHRGVESLMVNAGNALKTSILSENIAGDTAIAHGIAHASVLEALVKDEISTELQLERLIALELERIAIHLGDSAALCTDIAYQLGQVVNESLRTLVINTMQLWCGNRFGKGIIRPFGTYYPLSREMATTILLNLDKVMERFLPMSDKLFSMPSVLARFDGIGILTKEQLQRIGAVGMAARMGGVSRDVRKSHPDTVYESAFTHSILLDGGDVLARALLRRKEIEQSRDLIARLISRLSFEHERLDKPDYSYSLSPGAIAIRLVEGWRGEICHVAVTDKQGKLIQYKIKDPSFHNWLALALALRGMEISDFPVCNKSFNLSYCGNDL